MSHAEILIERYPDSANDFTYELTHEHGTLDAKYNQISGQFGIASINVEPDFRRQGIGKALIRKSVEIALELDVRLIHSAINSREWLEAIEGVFDEENILIRARGTYTLKGEVDKHDAIANLSYNVWDNDDLLKLIQKP